jgi:hypothetical protein
MPSRHRSAASFQDAPTRLPISWTAVFVVLLLSLLVGAFVLVPEVGLFVTDPMVSP